MKGLSGLIIINLPVEIILKLWYSLDIFTSLHAFALETNVLISATSKPQKVDVNKKNQVAQNEYLIEFKSWKTYVINEYDWNRKRDAVAARWFPAPNPDYQSTSGHAIAPEEKYVIVTHRYAAWRVEDAGLASPFDIESDK